MPAIAAAADELAGDLARGEADGAAHRDEDVALVPAAPVAAGQDRQDPVPRPRGASVADRLVHVREEGAETGADFDFLVGCRGNEVPRDSH